jgi:hypothetical membrane protein
VPVERRLFTWGRRAAALAAAGAVVAMLVYPGGTYRDHTTSGYQFFHNFFSDLGATKTWSGLPNPIGAVLFVVSLVVLVLGMCAILAGLARVYARSPRSLPLIRVAVVAGVFVCASFIGVAVTPENRFLSTHVLFTKLAFRVFPAVPLFLGLAASRGDGLPSRVGVAWVAMVGLLVAYVVVLDWGPRSSTATGLVVQVTAQKIVAIGAVLLLVYQSIQAERLVPAARGHEESLAAKSITA